MLEKISGLFTGIIGLFLIILIIIAGVFWFLTPFFIISIRDRLIRIQALLEEQNENLPSRKRGKSLIIYESKIVEQKRQYILLGVITGFVVLFVMLGLLCGK